MLPVKKQRAVMRRSKAHAPETEELALHHTPEPDSASAIEMRQAVRNPHQASATTILSMQSNYGNQAVQRLLTTATTQPTIQRLPNVKEFFGTGFRRTFLPTNMQKPSTVSSGKDNSAFMTQVQQNEAVFSGEEKAVKDQEAKEEEITNLKMDLKMELAKPTPDQGLILKLQHQIGMYEAAKKNGRGANTGGANSAKEMFNSTGGVTDFASTTATGASNLSQYNSADNTTGTQFDPNNYKKVTSIGSADKASDLMGAATSLASFAGNISETVSIIKTLKNGNSVERKQARGELVDNLISFGQTLLSAGSAGVSLAGDFGGNDIANTLWGSVPGLGIAANVLEFIKVTKDLVMEAKRLHGEIGLIKEAKAGKNPVLKASLGHLRNRDIQLVADNSVKEIVVGLKLAANICTLTGVGAMVGGPLSLAATAMGAANTTAHALADSYRAGLVQEKRKQFKDNVPTSATDQKAKELAGDAAEVLISQDARQAVQTLILMARELFKTPKPTGQDLKNAEIALKALKLYGVTDAMLQDTSVKDIHIRALILSKLKESENPQNLGDRLVEVAKSISGKTKELYSKPAHIRLVAEIKDILKYGGKSGRRGTTWMSNAFFGKNVTKLRNQIKHLATLLNNDQLLQLNKTFPTGSVEWDIFKQLGGKDPVKPVVQAKGGQTTP